MNNFSIYEAEKRPDIYDAKTDNELDAELARPFILVDDSIIYRPGRKMVGVPSLMLIMVGKLGCNLILLIS